MSNLDDLAKALAQTFVNTETGDALLWKYNREALPGLRGGTLLILSIGIIHQDEQAQREVDGAKLLKAIQGK